MIVKKRCKCPGNCDCPYHFSFKHSGLKVPHRESTHTKNYKLAVRIADRRKDEILAAAKGVASAEPITVKLSAVVTKFHAWFANEYPATAASTMRVLPGFEKSFPDDPFLVDVKPFDLQRWRSKRLTEVARSTVRTEDIIVHSLFREAAIWYPGFVNPALAVPLWELEDGEVLIPTEDEVAQTLAGLPPQFALMCEVTLETLARVGEVAGLTVRDLSSHHGVCWLWRRLKGGKRKHIQISASLYMRLLALVTRPGQVYLFEARNKKGVWTRRTSKVTSTRFHCLFRDLGLPHLHHHLFRHLGITMMLELNVNPRVIQTFAGWSTLKMLQKYGHVRDAEMQRASTGNAEAIAAIKRGDRTAAPVLAEKAVGQ